VSSFVGNGGLRIGLEDSKIITRTIWREQKRKRQQRPEMRFKAEIVLVILSLVAVARIVAAYSSTSQAFDEPAHVAAGIEWLDRGTYLIDPLHPPLARVAIALPLYIAGLRLPKLEAEDSYFDIGNHILYQGGHYWRNLTLARIGILPFFLFGVWIVSYWAAKEFGSRAGILSAFCFTTLPGILTFAGLAYTDLPAAVMQFALIVAFTLWLEAPTLRSALRLGVAAGLAFVTKFTILIFFPAAAICILLVWILQKRTLQTRKGEPRIPTLIRQAGFALLLFVFVVWAGYRFSLKPVIEGMNLQRQSLPTFQHLPPAVQPIARDLVARDTRIPAPELLMGITMSYVLTHSGANSTYIFGKMRAGGTWYFFPAGLFFKNPLPFLILAGFGVLVSFRRRLRWSARAPLAATVGILTVAMLQKYNAGQRHVLLLYPLLAVLAGAGGAYLWQAHRKELRYLLLALIVWQGIETGRAGLHPMSYFNETAGSDPSKILITGCDLDCGQDVARLEDELKKRNVETVHAALFTSANVDQMHLAPVVDPLLPNERVSGWIAVSIRTLRLGDVRYKAYPPESFLWLESYKPVAEVGGTIRLYCIPAQPPSSQQGCTQ